MDLDILDIMSLIHLTVGLGLVIIMVLGLGLGRMHLRVSCLDIHFTFTLEDHEARNEARCLAKNLNKFVDQLKELDKEKRDEASSRANHLHDLVDKLKGLVVDALKDKVDKDEVGQKKLYIFSPVGTSNLWQFEARTAA